MHTPAAALPGAAALLVDPAGQRLQQQVFAPRARSAGNTELVEPLEPFTAPALLNSWANFGGGYNPAGFYKDRMGVVHLRGFIMSGVMQQSAFVLPAGYRPANNEFFAAVSNFAFGSVFVDPTGAVKPWNGVNTWISLDGITFRAV